MRKRSAGWARRIARRWWKHYRLHPPAENNRLSRAWTMADAERRRW